MPKIVAFGHKRQVGKNLACSILRQNICIQYPRLRVGIFSFAEPLYQICEHCFGLENKAYYDLKPEAKEIVIPRLNKTPREILEQVGSDFRAIDSEVWCNTLIDVIGKSDIDIALISDLRFTNEATALRKIGAILCRVDRDTGLVPCKSDLGISNTYHWDYIITNDGSKKDFNLALMGTIFERLNLEERTFTEAMRH